MKSIRSSMLSNLFTLAIGVAALSMASAYAQSAANGTFTLTHETRWGMVVLPAGSYSFALQSPVMPAKLVVRKTDGSQTAMLLPRAVSQEQPGSSSRLVLAHTGSGKLFVSELYLGDLGVSLHYTDSKIRVPATETAKLNDMYSHSGK